MNKPTQYSSLFQCLLFCLLDHTTSRLCFKAKRTNSYFNKYHTILWSYRWLLTQILTTLSKKSEIKIFFNDLSLNWSPLVASGSHNEDFLSLFTSMWAQNIGIGFNLKKLTLWFILSSPGLHNHLMVWSFSHKWIPILKCSVWNCIDALIGFW